VSPRLQHTLEALATGRAKTIVEAAGLAGLTREAVSQALRKLDVKTYMRETIMETLGIGATRASRRMVELLEADNSLVQFNASRFLLGTGARVTMPSPPSTTVNVGIMTEKAGFVIDLSERNEERRFVVSPADDPRVIEGSAEEIPAVEPDRE
jgi:hypothetical protein